MNRGLRDRDGTIVLNDRGEGCALTLAEHEDAHRELCRLTSDTVDIPCSGMSQRMRLRGIYCGFEFRDAEWENRLARSARLIAMVDPASTSQLHSSWLGAEVLRLRIGRRRYTNSRLLRASCRPHPDCMAMPTSYP